MVNISSSPVDHEENSGGRQKIRASDAGIAHAIKPNTIRYIIDGFLIKLTTLLEDEYNPLVLDTLLYSNSLFARYLCSAGAMYLSPNTGIKPDL